MISAGRSVAPRPPRPRPRSPSASPGRARGRHALDGRMWLAGRCRHRPRPGLQPAEEPPPGQVEVDRRDRDPAVDDRVEVGARDREARTAAGRRSRSRGCPADRAARRAGPGRRGGRGASPRCPRTPRSTRPGTLTLISSPRDRPCSRMLRATIVAASGRQGEVGVLVILLADREPRAAVDHRLHRRADRARVGDVVAEVRAVVDAGRDEVEAVAEVAEERDADRVGRAAVDGVGERAVGRAVRSRTRSGRISVFWWPTALWFVSGAMTVVSPIGSRACLRASSPRDSTPSSFVIRIFGRVDQSRSGPARRCGAPAARHARRHRRPARHAPCRGRAARSGPAPGSCRAGCRRPPSRRSGSSVSSGIAASGRDVGVDPRDRLARDPDLAALARLDASRPPGRRPATDRGVMAGSGRRMPRGPRRSGSRRSRR